MRCCQNQRRFCFAGWRCSSGGFDLDAAQAVTGGDDVERFQVLDQLTLLVDKSLVVAESSSGRTRYRLLETVRQYALEKLGESGEADRGPHAAPRPLHVDRRRNLTRRPRRGHEHRIEQAENEIANLRAAFGWSIETGDIKRALELASSLQLLWLTRGHVTEGLAWLDAALAVDAAEDDDLGLRGRARSPTRRSCWPLSVLPEGVDEADEALAIAREQDDPALLVRALMARGSVSSFDFEVARPYLNEAADLARELGNPWWLARILNWQAIGALQAGDMTATSAASEEALELAEAIGDKFVSRSCRLWLANARTYTGDLSGAAALFHEVIGEAACAHDVLVQVIGLVGKSFVDGACGATTSPREALADEALDCSARHFPYYDIPCYGAVTFSRLAAGDADAAWEASEAARQVTDGHPMTWGVFMVWAAQAAHIRGDLAEAYRMADEAVSMRGGVYQVVGAHGTRVRRGRARRAGGSRDRRTASTEPCGQRGW